MTHSLPLEVVELLSATSEVIIGKFSESCREERFRYVTRVHAIMLSGKDVVIDEALLSRCSSLRIVATMFKGSDDIDIEACTRNGVWVTTIPEPLWTPPSNPDPTLGAALEAAANIPEALIGVSPKGAINSPLLKHRPLVAHL